MTTLLAFVAMLAPDIQDYVQANFRDASFTAKVIKGDQRELRKINDDFGQSYRFGTVSIKAKDPFMLRLEANVDDTHILYVIDGPKLTIRIPRAGINSHQDLTRKPGRRQTLLDFGIVTPALFRGFFDATFVRMDRATGDAVFDLHYADRSVHDTSRHRIWIDPVRKILTKREWYGQEDQQLATFLYENPTKENGVWVPTQLTVKNNDGKVAGITRYASFKTNAGIEDSVFDVR